MTTELDLLTSNHVATYDDLASLRDAIANELAPVDVPINHYFVKGCAGVTTGVYAREAIIAKGTAGVGKIHKYEQLNIMTKGKMLVAAPGEVAVEVTAPYIIVTPPGIQRAIYAVEDSVWITIHGTNEQDVEVIERTFVVDSQAQFLEYVEQQLLEEK